MHFQRNWQKTQLQANAGKQLFTTECPSSSHVLFPSTSFYIPIVLLSVVSWWAWLCPLLVSELLCFLKTPRLTVGIFLDANCFRSSSVVQRQFERTRAKPIVGSEVPFQAFHSIFWACEVRLAASEGQHLNAAFKCSEKLTGRLLSQIFCW